MCTNKRWIINPYNGNRYFVPCGTCKACIAEKAGKRANRIVNNFSKDKVCLFCHFTYANDCLPYITWSDILKFKELYGRDEKFNTVIKTVRNEEKSFYLIPLYRDSFNRRVRFSDSWNTSKCRVVAKHSQIDVLPFEVGVIKHFDYWQNGYHHPTNHYLDDSLSVCYFKDIVDYIKRLREYVTYHKEIFNDPSEREFSYFVCSEFGENYARAHFHALIWVKRGTFKKWRSAIAANWLFDDYNLTYKRVEIAKKPASYVSTYVCGNFELPVLFQQPSVMPKWTFSKDFGFGNDSFSFPKVIESIAKGKAQYAARFIDKSGVYSERSLPLPSYVTNKYFPRFKGMHHLNLHETFNVFENPSRLGEYATKCNIKSKLELNKIVNYLINKKNQFYELIKQFPISETFDSPLLSSAFNDTFAYWCLACNSARKRSQWFNFFENQIDPLSIIYSYDNFADTFDKVEHNSFDYLDMLIFECDPNKYPQNLSKNEMYLFKYENQNKSHKIKNTLYGKYRQKSETSSAL